MLQTRLSAISVLIADSDSAADGSNNVRAGDVIDVSRPAESERTFAQALVSLLGAAGLALLLPFVLLAIGMPLVLAGRGLLEVTGWLVTLVR